MASSVGRVLAAQLRSDTVRSCIRPQWVRARCISLIDPAFKIFSPCGVNSLSVKWFSTKVPNQTCQQDVPEQPRLLPTSGFETVSADQLVEEEEISDYRMHRFYPVRLGEVFNDRYQVLAKLGFGSSSTTWLARDLREHRYVALKVYVHTSLVHRELPFYQHIASRMTDTSHPGQKKIRRLFDSFEVTGPDGTHIILVLEPAQMSLRDLKVVFRRDGFDEDLVKEAIIELLQALDFLHDHAGVIHTDVHFGNMLLGLDDNSLFKKLEDEEFRCPVHRKQVSSNRTIYLSRMMMPKSGPMLLSDFGEARTDSGPYAEFIMPLEYRAPEVLLYVEWSYPVDIWAVGLTAWELLEPKSLFTGRDEHGEINDAAHLAQLIAALGPPPMEFLQRNPERAAEFWDEQEVWKGPAFIPESRTLEALETRLRDNSHFLRFLRRALAWIPEERPTAKELLKDPWLVGGNA